MDDKVIIQRIKDISQEVNKPLDEIKLDFSRDFNQLFEEERPWLCNIEEKVNYKNQEVTSAIIYIIGRLKDTNYQFEEADIEPLSRFTGNINLIVRIANRINNFKQGTQLPGEASLNLPDLFNQIKGAFILDDIEIQLPRHLKSMLPHLFSVVKHCQDPMSYPVYYKYWKNIIREVLLKPEDYESFCVFYQTFPEEDRHLTFGTYLLTIGLQIIKRVGEERLLSSKEGKAYKYLKEGLLNVSRYDKYLNELFPADPRYFIIGSKYGGNRDVSPAFFEKSVVAAGFASQFDLSSYYNEDPKELVEFLEDNNEKRAINPLTHLLSLRPGDMVAVKADGSPKGNEGFLSIIGIAEVVEKEGKVYEYDPEELGHTIHVNFKGGRIYKVFNIGGYGRTIHEVTKPEHIRLIFETSGTAEPTKTNHKKIHTSTMDLNTILYGPPGTGKTYQTIDRALQIVDPVYYKNNREDRDKLTERFRDLLIKDWNKPDGSIAFITFHQSLSYEDFIEGIKPIKPDNAASVHFEILDGILKKLCTEATRKRRYTVKIDGEIRELTTDLFQELYYSFSASLPDHKQESSPVKLKTKEGAPFELFRNSADSVVVKAGTRKAGMSHAFGELSSVLFKGKDPTYKSYEQIVIDEILKDKEFKISEEDSSQKNFVLVIDEINRGNVSQIFGELITLIEVNKRSGETEELSTMLPYSKKPFSVPPNLYFIGTMNTADRSVEALDTALRRRFHFEEITPEPLIIQEVFEKDFLEKCAEFDRLEWEDPNWLKIEEDYINVIPAEGYERFKDEVDPNGPPRKFDYYLEKWKVAGIVLTPVRVLQTINERIELLLNRDHLIGHSYFIKKYTWNELADVFYKNIIPLLQEYFFGDYGKIGLVLGMGFVKIKLEENNEEKFAEFDYDSSFVDSKVIYELIDYRKTENYMLDYRDQQIEMNFQKAISLLLKEDIHG